MEQIEGEDDIDGAENSQISLSMPVLKEIGAKSMVEMAEHVSDNPQNITNGFQRAIITGTLSGAENRRKYSRQVNLYQLQ